MLESALRVLPEVEAVDQTPPAAVGVAGDVVDVNRVHGAELGPVPDRACDRSGNPPSVGLALRSGTTGQRTINNGHVDLRRGRGQLDRPALGTERGRDLSLDLCDRLRALGGWRRVARRQS